MNVEITSRHCHMSNGLKERTEARIRKMQRYFDRLLDARVVVTLERNRYNAEATVLANGTPLSSHAEADSDKVALDQVLDKIEVQIRRHKDRMTRNRRKGGDLPEFVASPDDGSEEEMDVFDETDLEGLVSEDAGEVGVSMDLAEAAVQLRSSRREVLGFTSKQTGRVTLLFRRRDGNLGVVDIQND